MVFNTDALITELKEYIQHHTSFAKSLLELSDEKLQFKINPKSWSVLECLEHLNLYADFYIPEIRKRIQKSNTKPQPLFKSGFLGNKLSEDMLPKQDMKTMNTFKSKNPVNSNLNARKVILRFIQQQEELTTLLDLAKTNSLTKIKTSLTLPLLKFRLGDTFRFVIYHNERHIVQVKNVLKQMKSSSLKTK